MTATAEEPRPTPVGSDVRGIDADALRTQLEQQIDGEVRFDKVSRALYSTDASVYQIEPIGVVVPRSARRP